MENYLKKIILIGSTSVALLLCPVISGGMTGKAFATVEATTNTEVQKEQHNQASSSSAVSSSSNSASSTSQVASKDNNSSDTTTVTNNNTNTTTTYDKPATNNQLKPNNSDNGTTTGESSSTTNTNSSDGTNQTTGESGNGFAMIGAGKSGSAATGSSVEQRVKPVIDALVPSGQITNTDPSVNQVADSRQGSTGNDATVDSGNQAATQRYEEGQYYVASVPNNAGQVAANQYLSQRGLGKVTGNSKKSIKHPLDEAFGVSNDKTAASNKIKLVSVNAFYNEFYKKAQKNQRDSGKIVTASGKKAVITTPTKKVNYSVTGQGATMVTESMPLILSTIVIGLAVAGFIIFDPLRFIFK